LGFFLQTYKLQTCFLGDSGAANGPIFLREAPKKIFGLVCGAKRQRKFFNAKHKPTL
jgi:hypothetical protein